MDPLLTLAIEVQCIARLDPAGLLLRLHQLAIWHSHRDVRTRLPESLPVMGTGLGNRGALLRAHPRVPLGVLYLPLRLLGLSRGSHGCQSSLPARDGS